MIAAVASRVRTFRQSTLFMNALYLMLSTLVMAASGFVFWVVVARGYETAAVGLATTLLSVSGLLSLLGLAGFDTTFVRFLPSSRRKNAYINSGFVVVTLASTALSIGVALVLPLLSPHLSVLGGVVPCVSFVFFTVATSLNILTNAVFLGFKQARYIFIINALFSACKIALPFIVRHGNAMTIFDLAGSTQLIGLVLSIAWMRRKFDYKFLPQLDMHALRLARKFSFSVYASSILNLLPSTLLPLLIIHYIGPKNAAYYYMAFTIAGVLYTIAYASMQSVFVEGSHNEAALGMHVAKAIKLVAVLLVPAAFLTVIVSGFLLGIFGREYALKASALLQLFALSALPVAAYSALGAIFKVTKNLRGVVSMNLVYAAVILSLSYVLLPRLGLISVGWAWAIGNLAACGTGAFFLIRMNHKIRESDGKTS